MLRMVCSVIALCLLAPLPGLAELFDKQKMQRDLEIAEGILGRLQRVEAGPLLPQARGLYLQGYGALFLSQGTGGDFLIFRGAGGREEEFEKRIHVQRDTSGGAFAQFKERTGEFFRSYADAIGQLAEDERITVLSGDLGSGMWGMMMRGWGRGKGRKVKWLEERARPAPEGSVAKAGGEGEEKEVIPQAEAKVREAEEFTRQFEAQIGEERTGVFFEATVKKSELSAYRRGRLSQEEFEQRIAWREHQPDPEMNEKIDIMAGILEKVLTKGDRPGWGPGRGGFGVYHEGIGVILYVDVGTEGAFVARALVRRAGEDQLAQLEAQAGEERAKLKEELVNTLAEYGHTLPLKPHEQVVVEVRFGAGPWTGAAGRLLFKARREDLDAYRKDALSLEQFRQRVEIAE